MYLESRLNKKSHERGEERKKELEKKGIEG